MDEPTKNEKENAYLKTLCSSLNQMREEKIFTDLEVICDTQVFHVHSAIMSAASTYFRKLLTTGNKLSKVSLHKIPSQVFSYLLKFIYTGTIEEPMDFKILSRLIEACKWLNIPDLLQHIGSIAGEFISYANYLTLWNLADEHRISSLTREIEDFVASNYLKLTLKDTFRELTAIRLKRIFCNRNFPEIRSEMVLDTLSNWSQEKTDRQLQLPILMQICRTNQQKNKMKMLRRKAHRQKEAKRSRKSLNSKDSMNSLNDRAANFSISLTTTEKSSKSTRKKSGNLHQALTEENIFIPGSNLKQRLLKPNSFSSHKTCESNQTYCLQSSTSTLYENSTVDEGSIHSEPIISRCLSTKKKQSIHSCQMSLFGRKKDSGSIIENTRRLCKSRTKKEDTESSKNPLYLRNCGNSEWMNHLQEIWNCDNSSSRSSSDISTVDDVDVMSLFTYDGTDDSNMNPKINPSRARSPNSDQVMSMGEELKHLFSEHLLSEEKAIGTPNSLASTELLFRIMNTMQSAWRANDTVVSQLVEEMKSQKDVILELSQENKKLLGVIFGNKYSSIDDIKSSALTKLKNQEKRVKANLKGTQSCDLTYPSVASKSFPTINKKVLKRTRSMKNHTTSTVNCSIDSVNHKEEKNQLNTRNSEKTINEMVKFKNSMQKGYLNNFPKMKHSKGRYNIVGCRNMGVETSKCPLRAATNHVFEIYIGRCQPETTEKDLSTYLLEGGIKIIECEKLSRENKSLPSTSFRVKVQAESFESLFKAEKWPKGIVVHPFYRKGAAVVQSSKEITVNKDNT